MTQGCGAQPHVLLGSLMAGETPFCLPQQVELPSCINVEQMPLTHLPLLLGGLAAVMWLSGIDVALRHAPQGLSV